MHAAVCMRRRYQSGLVRLVNELEIIDGVVLLSEVGISNLNGALDQGRDLARFQSYSDRYAGICEQLQSLARAWVRFPFHR